MSYVFYINLDLGKSNKKVPICSCHPDGRTTSVPIHAGESIGRGLLNDILEDIKMSPDTFRDLY